MDFRNFTYSEFDCPETGENQMQPSFIRRLDTLRDKCGFPFVITSGYRSPRHSLEAIKDRPGPHAHGIAADIRVTGGVQRRAIVWQAMLMGFPGIGVYDGHVHLDDRTGAPVMWAGKSKG